MTNDELSNILHNILDPTNEWILRFAERSDYFNHTQLGFSPLTVDVEYTQSLVDKLVDLYKTSELKIWQLSRVFNISYDEVTTILTYMGINWLERTTEKEQKFVQLSSPYILFDGAANILYSALSNKKSPEVISSEAGIAKTTVVSILSSRAVPSKEHLFRLADVLGGSKTLELWKFTSKDIAAVLDGLVRDDAPHSHTRFLINKKTDEIGDWAKTKKIIVRSVLAQARLRKRLTLKDCGNLLHILDWQYFDLETGRKLLTIEQAKTLALYLGVKYWQDLFIVEILPINYERYYLEQFTKYLELNYEKEK